MDCSLKLTLAAAVAASLTASSARGDWALVLPGPVERVAASTTHVAASRGSEVWLFADDGTAVGLLAGRRERNPSGPSGEPLRQAEQILDRFEVSLLERDADWADDLVYDERTLAERRAAVARPPAAGSTSPPRPTLVADDDSVWLVAGREVWRIDAGGHAVRTPARATGTVFAATKDGLLAGSREGLVHLPADGAAPVPLFAGAAEHAAISASGNRWAWSTGTNIGWRDADQAGSLRAESAIAALAYCGETLVAVLADSLVAIPPAGGASTLSRELGGRRWFCPSRPTRPWLALGAHLSASVDQGRSWSRVAGPPSGALLDAAASAHHVWVATTSGLYVSSSEPTPEARSPPRRSPRGHGKAAVWLSWLPKVSVQAMTRSASGTREVEALALAQIPLEPRPLPVVQAGVVEEGGPSEPVAARLRASSAPEPRDPDRGCLGTAGRKAVALALAEPERAESYVSRAGHAAWLPELRVLVSRRYGRSESVDVATSSTALSSPLGIDTVNDIRYEARATWDLAKLVFSTEELAAQNQAMHMAELRRDIETTVNRLYFERRRLSLEHPGSETWARQARVREIEAELDALSAGAFTACTDGKP